MRPRPPLPRFLDLALPLALASCGPLRASDPPDRFRLSFALNEEGDWQWSALQSGRVSGPNTGPFVVPQGQVLVVEQVNVVFHTSQEGSLTWTIMTSANPDRDQFFNLNNSFQATRPAGSHGEFIAENTAGFEVNLVFPAGFFIYSPCGSPSWAHLRSAVLVGRLSAHPPSRPPAPPPASRPSAEGRP